MRKQDIYIMLKLACMQRRNRLNGDCAGDMSADYTARGLSSALGVSKSEVNASIRRSGDAGLIVKDHKSGVPKVNRHALLDLIVHGIKYVFPVKPGAVVTGVPTACYAPVFDGTLHSMSDSILVWPYAGGHQRGQSVSPLHESVPKFAPEERDLYDLLALVDSIRLGQAREASMAAEMLEARLAGDG